MTYQTVTINIIDYTWTYDNIDKYIAVIVISIKLANKNKVTLIGYYRQWNIPMTPDDIRYKEQTFRYDRIIQILQTFMMELQQGMTILTQYCDMNDRIDTVFDYDMSNDIANILIDEINNIIQTIAPKKLIQCKKQV